MSKSFSHLTTILLEISYHSFITHLALILSPSNYILISSSSARCFPSAFHHDFQIPTSPTSPPIDYISIHCYGQVNIRYLLNKITHRYSIKTILITKSHVGGWSWSCRFPRGIDALRWGCWPMAPWVQPSLLHSCLSFLFLSLHSSSTRSFSAFLILRRPPLPPVHQTLSTRPGPPIFFSLHTPLSQSSFRSAFSYYFLTSLFHILPC